MPTAVQVFASISARMVAVVASRGASRSVLPDWEFGFNGMASCPSLGLDGLDVVL
jgi:hypothetical protein